MAEPDRNNRRADKAELARHLATGETLAFMTALVGLLNATDADAHRGDHEQRMLPPEQSPAAPHPADTAPAFPAQGQPDHGNQHTDTTGTSSGDAVPVLHVDAGPEVHPQDQGATVDAMSSAEGQPVVPLAIEPSPTVADVAGHIDVAQTVAADGESTASMPSDPWSAIQQLGNTIAHVIDTSLATLSLTLENLTTTVTQVTSSLTNTLGQTAGELASSLGDATDAVAFHAPIASSLETSGEDMSSPAAPGRDDFAGLHDVGMLDIAGAVPIAPAHPAILNLGFLGQPTIDGHDMHDGAFSALGIHHF